jgi:hypothetical protein
MWRSKSAGMYRNKSYAKLQLTRLLVTLTVYLPNPGSTQPIEAPRDPWDEPIKVSEADKVINRGTNTSIGINPDDDLLGM